MALDSMHPLFGAQLPDWVMLRDFVKGERAVKAKTTTYLPPTKGMLLDGMVVSNSSGVVYGIPSNIPNQQIGTTSPTYNMNLGQETYNAYLLRAYFPEYMKDALEIFMGMLHNKSPVIELPEKMESLRDNATEIGEPLELLLQRINLEQLTTGRLGLLVDLPETPDPANPLPFIALYVAEAIRNWDNDAIGDNRATLNLVVLDETSHKRQPDFLWKTVAKYRVLMLSSGAYMAGAFEDDGGTPDFDESKMQSPQIRGKKLNNIPFFFVNSKDIAPEPDEPPLVGLARLCGAIYRGEADYRQNLFMQGQDTLVIIGERAKTISPADPTAAGGEEPLRTGAGSRIELEATPGADAKYVGVQSQGLVEQRYALENDRKRAESRSGQLIDAAKGDKESGTALKTRVGAQTATLNQIAKTGALALELALKQIATWIGEDPKKVKVQPNLEFADYQMSGQDLVNLMTAKRTGGAPLSIESIHRLMVQGNLTQFDYQTERALIDAEEPFVTPEAQLALKLAAQKPTTGATKPEPLGTGPAPKDPSNPAPRD